MNDENIAVKLNFQLTPQIPVPFLVVTIVIF